MRRERLPTERTSYTSSFRLPYQHQDGTPDTMKLYFTIGMYEDGRLGEVFVKADKTGTLVAGVLDNAAINMSIGLQYGIPLDVYLSKMRHTRFSPSGFTKNPMLPSCSSPLDLLAQWLESKFIHFCPDCKERTQKAYMVEHTCICKKVG